MSDYLQKIIYLTQAQYNTLKSNGTVENQTGINDNYLYFITDEGMSASDLSDDFILPVTKGGTGKKQITSGSLLVGNGTAAMTEIAATNVNTANTIVKRDGNGDFSMGALTATKATINGTILEGKKLEPLNQINSDGGNMILGYKKSGTGVSTSQWCVGTVDIQGVIRSSNTDLLHSRNGTNSVILDAGNYTSYAVAKTAGVTAVTWDSTNNKLTRTINGSTADVVTAATLKAAINITAADLGLSNALHFIGITSTTLENGSTTATLTPKTSSPSSLTKTTGFVDGDVVMDGDQLREYVWSGSAWRLLGITTSTAYTQPASTATNTWIAQVSQGTDGKITATTGSLNTSGPWSGNAATATKSGVAAIWLYPENNNEINFGGTNTSTTLYFGYRAKDSRSIPTKFVFGSSTGTADLQAKTLYLGSGTSSYISSTQYTGNAATATTATQLSFKNGRIASADLDISTMHSRMLLTLASSSMTTNKPPMGDGYIVTYGWDSAYWGAQQAISHTKTPHMAIRGTNGSSTNDWGNWIYLLDANNYTDYAAKTDGSNASGTWGISITGSAGSVAWANTGHPSTFPPTIGTTSTTAAAGDHTHTISLTQTGTSTVNLAANTVYTLTAGGSSVVFKTPTDGNTDTKVNVTATAAAITKNYLLMTSTAPTSTAIGHTALGSASLWVNAVDKGKFELVLGNATATTTAGGQFGQLALYSASTAGTYLKAADGTAWKTQTLQAKDGTIALTSDLPDGVSKTAAGLCPQLPNETTTTKFLRQDGTWQVPAYIADTHYTTHLYVNATAGGATSNAATANTTTYMHLYDNSTKRETIQFKGSGATTVTATGGVITINSSDNNTATATDNILDGSNSGTAITYAPYTAQQAKLSFDTSTTAPTRTDRLNLNGFLYATKYNVAGQVTLQWNSADSSLDFVFA